jgi:sulfur-oxidizing protein SoxY
MLARRSFVLMAAAGAMVPRGAGATPDEVRALIRAVTGEAGEKPGRVRLDVPQLVENGNAVALGLTLGEDVPAGAVLTDIHVFADGNPRPDVAHFRFGPRAGVPKVATRIRLSTSQTVHALAVFADGSCWQDSVSLIVAISACLDD